MIRRFYLDRPHGQMHGRICPAPGQPWLTLLHQSPSASAMYEPLMQALAGRHAMLAPDNPGFGGSDPWPGALSVDLLADEVIAALDAHGIGRTAVFGHHTGAAVAANLAVRHPQRVSAVILSGPPALPPEQRAALPALAPVAEPVADGSHFAALWSKLRSKETEAPPALSTREVALAMAARASTRSAYQAVADEDFLARLAAITQPVLMFTGDRDSLAYALPLAQAVAPTAQSLELADAGGYVCEMRPQLVAGLITRFLTAKQP